MKVLIFGTGAVGSVFGGFLSRGHDVTLLGRKKHLDAIRKKGLKVSGIWGRFHFKNFSSFETSARVLAAEKKKFGLILVPVKCYDTLRAGRWAAKIGDRKTIVISLQNGLGNSEALRRFIPEKQLLAGRVIFGAAVPKPGHVKITVMAEPTAVGEAFSKKETARVREIARLFSKAGVPSVACADVRQKLWAKVIYNCALNPLASLLNCHYGKLTEEAWTKALMDQVIGEIYAIAKKARVGLFPKGAQDYKKLFYSKLVPRTYDHRPSMLQDLERGRRTEISALNGAIAKMGKKFKVGTPVNRLLATLIRRAEAGR